MSWTPYIQSLYDADTQSIWKSGTPANRLFNKYIDIAAQHFYPGVGPKVVNFARELGSVFGPNARSSNASSSVPQAQVPSFHAYPPRQNSYRSHRFRGRGYERSSTRSRFRNFRWKKYRRSRSRRFSKRRRF